MSFRSLLLFAASAVCALLLSGAPVARACGGFFCQSPTQPIAQGGEKIVFAVDPGGAVTAVVQIDYTGPADAFAWILPVPNVPTVSVGTTMLVQGLDQATTPMFRRVAGSTEGTCTVAHCSFPEAASRGGCCFASAASRGGFLDAGGSPSDLGPSFADSGAADSGVTVLARDEVGPYDYVVLTGSSSIAVHDWLVMNGYLVPATTTPLLDPYVATHSDFIAVKLTKGATPPGELPRDVGSLAPLVLHYTSGDPCIPIRLTALATVPDMPITAFFLAASDVRPDNYLETELPDDPLLWTAGGTATYDTTLSRAVDDAGGHAWIREYTGAVPSISISTADLTGLDAVTDPRMFVQDLVYSGVALDAQVLDILAAGLPPPPGITSSEFFTCLSSTFCTSFDAYLSTVTFVPGPTAARLDAEVVGPRREAVMLLATHARLTRLGTTMSADEMTLDPTFVIAGTTHDVSNVHLATTVTKCSADYLDYQAPIVLRMPSGAESTLRAGTLYPGDETYCRSIGGMPSGSAPAAMHGCTVGTSAPPLAPLVVGLVLAVTAWRRRR